MSAQVAEVRRRSRWRSIGPGLRAALVLCFVAACTPSAASAVEVPSEEPPEAAAAVADDAASSRRSSDLVSGLEVLVVLPFTVHSLHPQEHLAESLPLLLASRLEGTGKVAVVSQAQTRAALPPAAEVGLTDSELRQLANHFDAVGVVAGSLTELAGRYSLDVRITPAATTERSHTLFYTAEGEQELIARLAELTENVLAVLSGTDPGRIIEVNVVGAGELEPKVRELIGSREGTSYDPVVVQADRDALTAEEWVARASVETERRAGGVVLSFNIVRAEMILGQRVLSQAGVPIVQIDVRGNRRIEADAIRSRIRTEVGDPLSRARLADDIREIHGLGFFDNVYVFAEDQEDGVHIVFEVDENPVIRQISIVGNDNVDSENITDVLTLTTGSTLDYPLLHENVDRISSLYRQQG